jgi:ribosomal protein L7/L12
MVKPSSSKLHLIRAYMDETGVGLDEAKTAVEMLLGEA